MQAQSRCARGPKYRRKSPRLLGWLSKHEIMRRKITRGPPPRPSLQGTNLIARALGPEIANKFVCVRRAQKMATKERACNKTVRYRGQRIKTQKYRCINTLFRARLGPSWSAPLFAADELGIVVYCTERGFQLCSSSLDGITTTFGVLGPARG